MSKRAERRHHRQRLLNRWLRIERGARKWVIDAALRPDDPATFIRKPIDPSKRIPDNGFAFTDDDFYAVPAMTAEEGRQLIERRARLYMATPVPCSCSRCAWQKHLDNGRRRLREKAEVAAAVKEWIDELYADDEWLRERWDDEDAWDDYSQFLREQTMANTDYCEMCGDRLPMAKLKLWALDEYGSVYRCYRCINEPPGDSDMEPWDDGPSDADPGL